jgi:Holliday junction resolvase RusA-like endonuclease
MALRANRRTLVRIELPEFLPSKTWRLRLHRTILSAKLRAQVPKFKSQPPLELRILLRLPPRKLTSVDVDNAAKKIMDALQGAVGGEGKKTSRHKRLIHNDSCICRLTVEKRDLRPGDKRSGGYLILRPLGSVSPRRRLS